MLKISKWFEISYWRKKNNERRKLNGKEHKKLTDLEDINRATSCSSTAPQQGARSVKTTPPSERNVRYSTKRKLTTARRTRTDLLPVRRGVLHDAGGVPLIRRGRRQKVRWGRRFPVQRRVSVHCNGVRPRGRCGRPQEPYALLRERHDHLQRGVPELLRATLQGVLQPPTAPSVTGSPRRGAVPRAPPERHRHDEQR